MLNRYAALTWAGVVATSASLVVAAGGNPAPPTTLGRDLAAARPINPMAQGHPTLEEIAQSGLLTTRAALAAPIALAPDAPPDSPITRGPFINYESPQIAPLTLSADGSRLYVTDTPNNSVVVLDTTGPVLSVVAEIPVGLDPVALALRPGPTPMAPANELWVSCRLSDRVNVVDLSTGEISAIIPVGDEPGVILFTPDGLTAFVVCSGPPTPNPGDLIREQSGLVAISAGAKAVVGQIITDCNGAHSAVFDPVNSAVILSPHLSGNNTTVVGQLANFQLFIDPANPSIGTTPAPFPDLIIGQTFSLTAPLFASGGSFGLGAWPDPSSVPGVASPFVERIVPDAGVTINNPWGQIIGTISDGAGNPNPAMVALFEAENPAVANAFQVFTETINDVKDTTDNDIVVIDVTDPANMTTRKIVGNVGTTLNKIGRNPVTGDILVLNVEANNVTRLEPVVNGVFVDHQLVIVSDVLGAASITRTDLNAGIPNFNDPSVFNAAAHASAMADPIDIAFRSTGDVAFIAALGSDRVAAVNAITGGVIGRVDVGRGPRGLVYDDASARLYVINRTDMSISVINATSPVSMAVVSTFNLFNPEPPEIKDGRDFLYSARFSNLDRVSCSSCHVDAKLDDLAWDLGDAAKTTTNATPHALTLGEVITNPCATTVTKQNHPVKGPMVTLSLQGMRDHEPLHWRGDKTIFEDFNGAFASLLGGTPLSPADMQRYRNFAMSIEYPPTPHRNPDNTFKDPNALSGRALLVTSCDVCHNFDHDGVLDVTALCPNVTGDTANDLSGIFSQIELVTQLRDIRKKFDADRFTGFGLVHDGRDERENFPGPMEEFLNKFFGFNPVQQAQGTAFTLAWQSNTMPIVGAQSLALPPPAGSPTTPPVIDTGAINLMIQQSRLLPSRNDVVAKGIVGGIEVGYWMIATDPAVIFRSDQGELLTLDQLFLKVQQGATLMFMAVPPGSGRRIGIDQDNDCLSNGFDPNPQVPRKHGDLNSDGVVGSIDLAQMLGLWGSTNFAADIDNSGSVGAGDLAAMLGMWGVCP